MEQNQPLATKKAWSLVRLIVFMLRKKISKTKVVLDLNMMIKRGKIAGKALHNLMVHHHHHRCRQPTAFPPNDHYEFSCSNSPVYPLPLFTTHKDQHGYKTKVQKKSMVNNDHDEIFIDPAVIKALEMLTSAAASPAVHGFGRSPMVRQLRITDSPFPLVNEEEEDSYVDEAAERFIIKFYDDLRRQC